VTAEQPLPRYVTSIVGPGDPVWHGKPDRDRSRRILLLTPQAGYYRTGPGAELRRLRTPIDYAELNRVLG
jgi:hypothetical protein